MDKKSFFGKKIYWIVGLVILTLITVTGFFIYLQIETSNKVAKNVNESINIINQNQVEINQLITKTIADSTAASSSKNSIEYKAILESSLKSIDILIADIMEQKESLSKGPNTDTEEFTKQIQVLMDYRAADLKNFQNLLVASICYNDKNNLMYGWVEEFDKQWSQLDSSSDKQVVSDLATKTGTKVAETKVILPQIIECFKNDFPELIKPENTDAVTKEVSNYDNLESNLKKFASSISNLNQVDYDTSSSEIKKISQNQSEFQKITKGLMDSVIDKYNFSSQQQIAFQEQNLNQILVNLKAKYRLDTTINFR